MSCLVGVLVGAASAEQSLAPRVAGGAGHGSLRPGCHPRVTLQGQGCSFTRFPTSAPSPTGAWIPGRKGQQPAGAHRGALKNERTRLGPRLRQSPRAWPQVLRDPTHHGRTGPSPHRTEQGCDLEVLSRGGGLTTEGTLPSAPPFSPRDHEATRAGRETKAPQQRSRGSEGP